MFRDGITMTANQAMHTKGYMKGAHRSVAPEQTIARAEPHFARCGITRVANVTGLDRIGIPVIMVMRPNSRSVAVSQGKGVDVMAAKASGIMEAIETWHAERIDVPMLYGRADDLTAVHRLIDVARLPQVSGSVYNGQKRLMWVQGGDLMGGPARWVPYEMVHTDYTHPRPEGHGCFACSSNGLASGNNLLEANIHAICEIIERDATGLWYLSAETERACRRLDLSSVDDAECSDLIERIAMADLDLAVWETTSDVGVPAFYCLLSGNEHEHVGEGAGCHPCKAVALSRTLTEAAQTRLTYISGARDDMLADEFTERGRAEKQGLARRLTATAGRQIDYSDIAEMPSLRLDEDLQAILGRLGRVGIAQVISVDLTRPDIGIAVVRIVIPGLEAPHDDHGYVPGRRAREVMRGAG